MQQHAPRQTAESSPQPAQGRKPGRAQGAGNGFMQRRIQDQSRTEEVGAAGDPEEAAADRLAEAALAWMASSQQAPANTDAQAEQASGPVPTALLAAFDAVAGFDAARVPVVVGGAADQEAGGLGAEAYAREGTVFLRSEAYAPNSQAGQRTLAHELAHVALGHARTGQPTRRRSDGSSLRRGDRGTAVASVQDQLVRLGFMTAAQKATGPGNFGPMTHSAVVSFQAANGLERDGVVGPRTRTALANAVAARSAPAPTTGGGGEGTSTAPSGGSTAEIRRGASGAAVQRLQGLLVQTGYMTAAQAATGPGVFGPMTQRSVLAFQADQRLAADGVVGPRTWAALEAAARNHSHSPANSGSGARSNAALTGRPALREGDEGVLVQSLQRLLNQYGGRLGLDGEFGPVTARNVRAFQQANGLTADGIVGPGTATRLNSGSATRYTLSTGGGGDSSTGTSAPPTGSADYDVDDADPKNVLNQGNLNPTVKALAVRTIESMQAQGYAPYLFEGHRTMARQNSLYAQGRTAPGGIVTHVQGGGSWHNYGLAVDIVFWDRSHSGPSWGAPSSHWAALGRAGKSAGFTRWMGDTGWDQAHFEHHPKWGNGCTNLLSTYNASGFQAVWDKVI